MTAGELGQLLVDAAGEAERSAPALDPLRGLAHARTRRRQRGGHLVVGAFVLFTFLLQAIPSDALGAPQPVHVAAASTAPGSAGIAAAPANPGMAHRGI